MKRILIIGIGAGNPDYVTIQAVNALNEVDVFFVMDKGIAKEKLIALRKEICRRFIKGSDYRFAEATSPERVRDAVNYRASVEDLNDDKQAVFERLISEELSDGECGAFLTWGDPALYDSTIRIVDSIIREGGHDLVFEVIPGISSIQALAAQHKIPLNRIGESIGITTGRRIAEGFPDNVDSVVVMLDAEGAYKRFADQDIDIYWGAYIGTPDEILVSGKLKDVVGDIERIRAEARKANGWIMDSYLMRRNTTRKDN
ncbi:precorrin-6A synthase (deacetylating) [Caballeronia sp. KNU42]